MGRPVDASSTASGSAAHITDGDRDTWWEAADTRASVTVQLGRMERLGGVRLEEAIRYGQRITAFAVDVRCWKGWYQVARRTTSGPQRILSLVAAQGDALRLRILDSQARPVLARMMVYAR